MKNLKHLYVSIILSLAIVFSSFSLALGDEVIDLTAVVDQADSEQSQEQMQEESIPDTANEADEEASQDAQAAQTQTPALQTLTGLKVVPAGKNRVSLSWEAVSGAEGYLIYGQKNGKYGYVGMTTKGTTFNDTAALDEDYNFYWVFPYVKNCAGKMITGPCEKYVFAKGICAAVTGLKATALYGGVQLDWNKSYGAEGYLIYGKTASGTYGYKGMTQNATWTDPKASTTEYNFYWVFPYHKNGSGTMIPGLTGKYTYGKSMVYTECVSDLWAEAGDHCVQIGWTPAGRADGYLIYRQIGNGSFEYRYIVTQPGFIDTTASTEEFNFYRVYPYVMQQGKRIVGRSTSYVFAKAIDPQVYVDEAVSAYNKYLNQYVLGTSKYSSSPSINYYLLYVNNDYYPELILTGFFQDSYSEPGVTLISRVQVFTYINGKVEGLGAVLSYGGEFAYKPYSGYMTGAYIAQSRNTFIGYDVAACIEAIKAGRKESLQDHLWYNFYSLERTPYMESQYGADADFPIYFLVDPSNNDSRTQVSRSQMEEYLRDKNIQGQGMLIESPSRCPSDFTLIS